MKNTENALVILAGGNGSRFGKKLPKQFTQINGENLIHFFLKRIDVNNFDRIVIVCKKSYFKYLGKLENNFPSVKFIFTQAGKDRQSSSYNALKSIKIFNPNNVLIHDAARPFCSNNLIMKILKNLKKNSSAIPYIVNTDKKMILKKDFNKNIKLIQTPQGFKFQDIFEAHKKTLIKNARDDSSLITEKKINFVKGEKFNYKITFADDLNYFKLFLKPIFRSGIGYDIHQIDAKVKKGLKLCGVKINYNKLIGHSDADVGIHAICDSIFGALSMKDIGYYFSNSDPKWKNKN